MGDPDTEGRKRAEEERRWGRRRKGEDEKKGNGMGEEERKDEEGEKNRMKGERRGLINTSLDTLSLVVTSVTYSTCTVARTFPS